jgi:hypothetical protein
MLYEGVRTTAGIRDENVQRGRVLPVLNFHNAIDLIVVEKKNLDTKKLPFL